MLALKDFKTKSQLFSYLNTVYEKGEASALHFFVVIPDKSIKPDNLLEHAKHRGLIYEINKKSEDLFSFLVGVRKGDEGGYIISHNSYWIFITDTIGSKIKSFINNFFPILKLSYVNSHKMLSLLEEGSNEYDKVLFTEGTFCKEGETFRNWKKKQFNFSVKSLNDISKREKAKWTGISISCYYNDELYLKFRIYDRGHLTLYKGNFNEFYSKFLLSFSQ